MALQAGDATAATPPTKRSPTTKKAASRKTTRPTVPKTTAQTTAPKAPAIPTSAVPATVASVADGGSAADKMPALLNPKPLPSEVTVKVGVPGGFEAISPLYLADAFGELKKENVKVQYVVLPSADLINEMAGGRVDVSTIGLSAGVLNALSQGFAFRAVAPMYDNGGKSEEGLWLRNDIAVGAPASLKGKTIASVSGAGSSTTYPIAEYLATGGLKMSDVNFVRMANDVLPAALKNNAIQGAWLLAPTFQLVKEGGYGKRIVGNSPGKNFGYYFFGPSMFNRDRSVGFAFLRAIARSTMLYTQPGYHDSDRVMAALSKAMSLPVEDLRKTAELVFSPTLAMPTDGTPKLQQYIMDSPGGLLLYKDLIPNNRIYDTSWLEALGMGS